MHLPTLWPLWRCHHVRNICVENCSKIFEKLFRTDHLCLLPLNILNEKMYIVFWLWMYIVLGFSSFSVLYRIIVLGFPQTRHFLWGKFYRVARLRAVDTITDYCNYGDWFLLNMVSETINTPAYFRSDYVV